MHPYFQGNLIRGQAAGPGKGWELQAGPGRGWELQAGARRPRGLRGRRAGRVEWGSGEEFPPSIVEGSAGLDSDPESLLCLMSLSWWCNLSTHFYG